MPSPIWPHPISCDHRPNVPGSYAILFFMASEITSITSHIHYWALFSPLLHLFILSGVMSPLFSSSILGTDRPGEFISQCHIFLPFHTVHGALKARLCQHWSGPFSSRPCFVRTCHHDLFILGGPTQHDSLFHWVRQGWSPCDQFGYFSVIVVFILSALLWIRIRELWKLPDGRQWLWGKLGLVLMGGAMLSNTESNFLLMGEAVFPPYCLAWGQNVDSHFHQRVLDSHREF